ncbi:hypothetical protein Nepgr_023944 [Nepenthes gracilis]|uniref:Uncharacterized protein n=1 Tax=Nepenthes gracilis TaxID=150966 RepID=A0AAD3T583_NEPGR|nr:hypothetical protein Nepgr_023944 [Nepenthes gracilis]
MILSGAASSAKLMEVKVAYHSVPSNLKSLPKTPGPAVGKRAVSSPVCGGSALDVGVLNQQTRSPATVVTARGLASKMPSQIIDSDPILTSCDVYSASAGYTPEEDGAPSGSVKDVTAIGDTNAVHSVLDVGAPCVADHAADSPHRPLISTGVDGDAISVELGLIPGVDGYTPESIARITRKYSLVDVVEGLLNKAPIEFQEVESIPLSGCPVKGFEASVVDAVMICEPGRGLELTLPSVDPYAGDPLSDDYGILPSPDHHLPCCSMASGAPVGPSSEDVVAVQGLSPCNPCPGDPAGPANRSFPDPAPVTGSSYKNSEPLVNVSMDSGCGGGPAMSCAKPVADGVDHDDHQRWNILRHACCVPVVWAEACLLFAVAGASSMTLMHRKWCCR